jgi:hypothetical protein
MSTPLIVDAHLLSNAQIRYWHRLAVSMVGAVDYVDPWRYSRERLVSKVKTPCVVYQRGLRGVTTSCVALLGNTEDNNADNIAE